MRNYSTIEYSYDGTGTLTARYYKDRGYLVK